MLTEQQHANLTDRVRQGIEIVVEGALTDAGPSDNLWNREGRHIGIEHQLLEGDKECHARASTLTPRNPHIGMVIEN